MIEIKGRYYTKNLTPGKTFFDEQTRKIEGAEHRIFDPRRSKLSAALHKGMKIDIKGDVLYLGASHGYTVSFISDMDVGNIFAIDFAPRVLRDLVFLSEERKNIIPIMADANQPRLYSFRIKMVDFLFQDVAQKNQAEIFLKNMQFLKPGSFGALAVKSRSIDMARKPTAIYNEVKHKLEKEVKIMDFKVLDPFEMDHCVFLVQKHL
jgi:fibrillarin-like pre-rRNA processing protein